MMKKLLSLILVCLLCLPCAFAGEDVDALIASGQYDEAIVYLESEISRMQQMLAEVNSLRDAQNAGKVSVEVPITSNNWSEYFEVRIIPETDPFGELRSIDWAVVIREEYAARLDLSREICVDFQHTYETVDCLIAYDAENNTVTFGDKIGTDCHGYSYSEFTSINQNSLDAQCRYLAGEKDVYVGFAGNCFPVTDCGIPSCSGTGSLHGPVFTIGVAKAQGSLFLFEE